MPAVAAAAAAAVTWISSAAASAAALVATSLSVYTGLSIGTAMALTNAVGTFAINALGSLAINAVMAPRANAAGSPTSFKADPSSPIRGIMGRFGTGGTQNHMRVWGKDNLFISYSVILSLGPISGIDSFTARDLPVNFPGPQGAAAIVEPFRDKMWMTYKMGLPNDPALGPPVGIRDGHVNLMTEWTENHRTAGYAGAFWTMKNNSKRASYEGGVPKPNWVVKGMKLYDPRKDSTQTAIGGVGAHRVNDWRTWEYTTNPDIHAINWCLGHHKKLADGTIDRRFLLAGIGATLDKIDLPTFVAAANIADMNNWTISGEWSTQDDKWQVLTGMLQASSAVPVHSGAKIGVMINAPRASVATITNEDIIGKMNLKVMASRRDRFNAIFPRYINEQQGWEYSTAGIVTSPVYQAQDGNIERSKEMTYNYVDQSRQAGQLAAYDLANTRETLKVGFPAKPYLLGIKPGDAVTVNSVQHGLANQKFIVVARPIDLMEGYVSFELRSETDSKHAWALGQADQPAPSPGLTPFDDRPATPEEETWTVLPRPVEPGGTSQPGVVVGGEVPDGIGSVLIEVAKTEDGPWEQVYDGPPTTEKVDITGLDSNTQYWIGFTYRSVRAGIPSDRLIMGPYETPALVSDDAVNIGGRPVDEVLDDIDSTQAQLDLAVSNLNLAIAGLDGRLDNVEYDINDPTTGIKVRVTTVETKTADNTSRLVVVENAITTPTTGINAKIASLETATTNLALNKADASRVATLEANVKVGLASSMPSTFQQEGATWSSNYSGSPTALGIITPGAVYSFPAVASSGKVIQIASTGTSPDVAAVGAIPVRSGRKYRITAGLRALSPLSGSPAATIYAIGLDSTYTAITTPGSASIPLTANTWVTSVYEITADALIGLNANVAYLRPMIRMNGTAGANTFQLRLLQIEDITDVTSLGASITSLDTAVANLTTGKADVSRVVALEARADTTDIRLRPNANLLYNPSGNDALNGWTQSGSGGWAAGPQPVRGYWINRGFASAAGVTASLYSARFPATAGQQYVLSGSYYLSGRTAGSTFFQVDFLNAANAIIGGGSFARGVNNGEGEFAQLLALAPAGTTQAQVSATLGSVSGDANAGFAFYRLKFERGSVATPFSDETTDAALSGARRTVEGKITVLETATANLATGKADASRVVALEARASGSNLLTKSQFFGTETSVSPYSYAETNSIFDFQTRTKDAGYAIPGEGALQLQQPSRISTDQYANYNQYSVAIPGIEVGKRYCFSAYSCSLRAVNVVTGYFLNAAGALIVGSDFITDANNYNSMEKGGNNPSNINDLKRVFCFGVAPANAATAVVILRKYDTAVGTSAPDSYAMFCRMMFSEVSPTATQPPPWAPAAVEARVQTQEVATADLYGRTMARWANGTAVPGASTFIYAQSEVSPGAAPTSDVGIGAKTISLFNQSGGVWTKALEVTGGNAVFNGGLQAGAFIRLGNGNGWPVALKTVDFSAGDGEVVNFGTDLLTLPSLSFAMNNLLPLAAGETYDVKATGLTSTGFTLSAKINVPGTPTTYDRTASYTTSAFGSGGIAIAKTADPNSSDGTYRVKAAGLNHHAFFGLGGGAVGSEDMDYVTDLVQVWAKKGGVWQYVAPLYVTSVVNMRDYPTSYQNVSGMFQIDEDVQLGDGVQEVGLRHGNPDTYAYMGNFTHLVWTAPGTASSTRTALASGSKTRVSVRPQ